MRAVAAQVATLPAGAIRRTHHDVFLRKLAGFADLSEADLAALSRMAQPSRSVEAQTTLVQNGDVSDALLIVLTGFACCFRDRSDGRRQILGYLLPGDICDPDLVMGGRFDYAVGTLTSCRVARVTAEEFGAALARHPGIERAMRVGKLVTEAIWREKLVNLGRRTALERTAHLLCEILVRLQGVGLADGDSCDLPLNQNDLADTLGLSNVHTNRMLQALRGQGLIELNARRLVVKDVVRLRRLGDFSPGYLRSAFGWGGTGEGATP